MTPDHTPHDPALIHLDCPRCYAQWEVIRATQADPLTILDPLPVTTGTTEARRMEPILAFIALALLMVAIAIWSDRQAPR